MFSSDTSKQSNGSKQVTPNMDPSQDRETGVQHFREGPVARAIEKQTAQLPSDIFLWAAFGSIVLSLGLQLSGRRGDSNFVGHWAPTFLTLGLYNKLVKVAGHDRATE